MWARRARFTAPPRFDPAFAVEAAACGCDLDEDEYRDRADRAVGAYEPGERER
jgi:hypothetical protein